MIYTLVSYITKVLSVLKNICIPCHATEIVISLACYVLRSRSHAVRGRSNLDSKDYTCPYKQENGVKLYIEQTPSKLSLINTQEILNLAVSDP